MLGSHCRSAFYWIKIMDFLVSKINNDRVQYMIENLQKLEQDRFEFVLKYGFRNRTQNFNDCIVVRWKHRKRKDKDFIDYERIEEYASLCHEISEKYNLNDERNPLLEFRLKALKVGIYVFFEWNHQTWAIPNEFKEIQEFIIPKLPSWAFLTKKS